MSLISRPRLALLAAIVFAVAGCGRRGDLEPPSANAVQGPQSSYEAGAHKATKIVPPKKDFVLDPLLQ